MKVGVLFSGGKDSVYAAYLASKDHDITCLITIYSDNPDSFMFHTPSINQTRKQAKSMEVPQIINKTRGKKEEELEDLKDVIQEAKEEYELEGIVTGALASKYQANRIQKICDELGLECINPLWKKDQIELLEELVENKFDVIIIGVAAHPLDEKWLGRKIDKKFIEEVKQIEVNPAGEGGEFETFVLNCPLFKSPLKIVEKHIEGSGNAYRMDIKVE